MTLYPANFRLSLGRIDLDASGVVIMALKSGTSIAASGSQPVGLVEAQAANGMQKAQPGPVLPPAGHDNEDRSLASIHTGDRSQHQPGWTSTADHGAGAKAAVGTHAHEAAGAVQDATLAGAEAT